MITNRLLSINQTHTSTKTPIYINYTLTELDLTADSPDPGAEVGL